MLQIVFVKAARTMITFFDMTLQICFPTSVTHNIYDTFQLIKPSSGYREYPKDSSLQQEAIHGKIRTGMYVMLQ